MGRMIHHWWTVAFWARPAGAFLLPGNVCTLLLAGCCWYVLLWLALLPTTHSAYGASMRTLVDRMLPICLNKFSLRSLPCTPWLTGYCWYVLASTSLAFYDKFSLQSLQPNSWDNCRYSYGQLEKMVLSVVWKGEEILMSYSINILINMYICIYIIELYIYAIKSTAVYKIPTKWLLGCAVPYIANFFGGQ